MIIRTATAFCDETGCESLVILDPMELQLFRALKKIGWAVDLLSDGIETFCPTHFKESE